MRADSESHLYVTRPASETRRILTLLYEWLVLHVAPRLAIDGWFSRGLWYDRKYPSSGTDSEPDVVRPRCSIGTSDAHRA